MCHNMTTESGNRAFRNMPESADIKHMPSLSPSAAETLRVRRRVALLAVYAMLATAAVNLAPTTTASAATGYNEEHLVARVLDGDTIEVYPPGQTSGPKQVVRLVGVNTNETGMCHAAGATNRLKNLIEGERVTLKADSATSTAIDGRYLRFVEHNGVDMSLLMIEESRGFVFQNEKEPSRNEQYALASHYASVAGERIWDSAFCGNGPRQSAALRMIINWDAPGTDGNPGTYNGEWFRVFNDDATALDVGGWTIRESAARGIFDLPSGTRIPANGFLTVYAGSGSNTATKVYLGLERTLFSNEFGDAGFLLDPDDDIRVHFAYPCIVDCFDELQGALDMSVNADAEGSDNANPNGEWVNITNTSDASFNLYGYLLRSGPKSYAFPSNSLVHPGERLRLHIGSGNDSRLTKYWGRPEGILSNSGPDYVEIVTYDDIEIGRFAWPCNPCGPTPDVVIHDYRWEGGPISDRPNDEWLEIKNDGATDVNLRDWLVMDNTNRYHFDTSRILSPGATLRIYIGKGTDTGDTVYWGQTKSILFGGDKIQVFTPYRDLVACTAWGDKTCDSTTAPPATSCNGRAATILGTESSETIHGTSGDDVIVGRGGDDKIYGNGGNDTICGDEGADTLIGGGGNDTLLGGNGDDSLEGNSGRDKLYGNGGSDVARFTTANSGVTVDLRDGTATGEGSDTVRLEHLVGSDFDDHLAGNSAYNNIAGGLGDDVIHGRKGRDYLHGKEGNDIILGGEQSDIIWGSDGADVIKGGSGKDVLRGGSSGDTIRGHGGADTIYGQGGPDRLYGGSGSDWIDGGPSTDFCTSGAVTSCES